MDHMFYVFPGSSDFLGEMGGGGGLQMVGTLQLPILVDCRIVGDSSRPETCARKAVEDYLPCWAHHKVKAKFRLQSPFFTTALGPESENQRKSRP
mmetsp:Transcript_134130/g.232862  ORF Transcript_134130/g.232862 Transcript_134130/m.232862 type:complete len:95 (-) Transcript_134130:530-814(-)